MKATWSVAVVYEDEQTREAAVDFCDHLVERFWAKGGFDVSWWSFSQLREPLSAREATAKTRAADLVVVALQPAGKFDAYVQALVETGLSQRAEREGALVGLLGAAMESSVSAIEKEIYLRNLAHRVGMDYLKRLPPGLAYCDPDSGQSYTERADQITSVLDEILHQRENLRLAL